MSFNLVCSFHLSRCIHDVQKFLCQSFFAYFVCNFRLFSPESVQYFQFDSDGNIYVYCPGAGFSGIAKLVRPGADMNSTWNEDENISTEPELQLPFADSGFSESSTQRSYNSPLPEVEMEKLSHKNFSPETMKTVRWVLIVT